MKKLSDAHLGERNELVSTLTREADEIVGATNEVNEKVAALNEKIAAYNNTLKNVGDFRDNLVEGMQDYHGDKPEDWRDSEAGSNYQDWMDGWEDANFEPIDAVDQMDPINPEHAKTLQELPDSPE